MPKFLYEVDLYKITPNSASLLSSRCYISTKLLKIKESEVIKRFGDTVIERFITQIKTNNL